MTSGLKAVKQRMLRSFTAFSSAASSFSGVFKLSHITTGIPDPVQESMKMPRPSIAIIPRLLRQGQGCHLLFNPQTSRLTAVGDVEYSH